MNLFRLAERLGKTVGELRATMTLQELAMWPLIDQINRDKPKG